MQVFYGDNPTPQEAFRLVTGEPNDAVVIESSDAGKRLGFLHDDGDARVLIYQLDVSGSIRVSMKNGLISVTITDPAGEPVHAFIYPQSSLLSLQVGKQNIIDEIADEDYGSEGE